MVPAKGGLKDLKRKSSWHQRRRSKILAVSLTHWKGGGGAGVSPPPPAVHGRSNTSLPGAFSKFCPPPTPSPAPTRPGHRLLLSDPFAVNNGPFPGRLGVFLWLERLNGGSAPAANPRLGAPGGSGSDLARPGGRPLK